MTKQQIKDSIIELIDQIEEEAVLENCYTLLNSVLHLQENYIVAYAPDGAAMNAAQYEAEILQALEESADKRIAHKDIRQFIGL